GNAWPLLQEDSHQWVRLFTMLVKRYSGRNTLTLWEFRGVLYDLKNKQSGFFFRPAEAAAGVIRRAVSVFEQDRLRSKKVRQRLYRYIYNCIDRLETNIDVCGWKENGGKCLRHDYRCCTVHVTCKHYKDSQCVSEALTCKFWLCHAAIARASATGKGRFLLALRHILNFWCRALNIPLKIRCSFVESFDDNAKGRFTDVPEGDWYNKKY
ncbi:MAG: hypothetical protein FWC24_07415, partial [Treponema sp.]|nr:hypothetical protein [Treponema sp.]